MTRGVNHQPGLDGVRAIAIVMVILFHGGVSWAQGGYLGVDVFMVLSGYLITAILVDELRGRGRLDLRNFYARRLRRIGPALCVLLVAVAVYAEWFARPIELVGLRRDGIAAVLQVANWRFAFHGTSYFNALSPSLLQHTWSVSLEMQWYLVWPLAIGLLVRTVGRSDRALGAAVALLALASAAECALLFHLGASDARLYYGSDTRSQALLVGATLAVMRPRLMTCIERHPRRRDLVELIGLLGAAALTWVLIANPSRALLYRGGLLVVALSAGAVVLSASLTGFTARACSIAPIRAIGLISYSLYLWHWPIDIVVDNARTGLTGSALLAVRTALAFAFATASYLLVEKPARRLRTSSGARVRLASASVVIAGVLAVSFVASTAAAPAEQPSGTVSPLAALRIAVPIIPGVPRVYVAGDSQAFSVEWWGSTVFASDHRANFRGGAEVGCGVVDIGGPNCVERDRDWRSAMAHFNPDLTVLWIGAWEATDFTIDGHTYRHGTKAHEQQIELALESAVHTFTARGGKVVLLEVPCFDTTVGSSENFGTRDDPRTVDEVNDAQRAVAARLPNLVTFMPWTMLCRDNTPVTKINGVVMRPDGVHFQSEAAAGMVLRQLMPIWVRLGRSAEVARARRPRSKQPGR
ncbi:MAG TPA: acyltransferase family protein [Acidimicrobiia bacterium]|jgi:peptidoglycan/LPS O-acetylase OafA/YrhL